MTSPPILRSSVMLDISIAQFGQSMAINNASSCSAPKRKSEAVSKLNSSSSRLVVAGFSPRSTRWKQTRAKARDYKFEQSIVGIETASREMLAADDGSETPVEWPGLRFNVRYRRNRLSFSRR